MVQPGDRIGPYAVQELIAEGGMGAVYRAQNRVTGQLRAIKVIKADLAKKPDFVDRFVREATIASQVRHPYLVETLEPGIDGETIYLPMELLVGETLFHRLRRVKRMSPQQTAAILGPVCDAVQALHDKRLVHRDLKPMNVFLTQGPDGTEIPKVLDFGTARDEADDEHTKTGMVVGSPFYMAPEQAEGRRDVDARADQYAVGVMAYQMLTSVRPYESDDTRSALAKLLRGEPYVAPKRMVAAMPDAFEAVIVRALHRERAQRFPRVADLGAALLATANGPVTLAPAASSPPPSTGFGALLHSAPTSIHPSSVPPPALPASMEGPGGVPAHFTPHPGGMASHPPGGPTPLPAPAVSGPSRAMLAGGAAIVLALTALLVWRLAPSPPAVTATELPRARSTVGTSAASPPSSVPSSPPAAPEPPRADIVAPPPLLPPPIVPPVVEVEPEAASAEPPEVEAMDEPGTVRRVPRGARPGGRSPVRTDPEPECGAATGIPCMD